MRNFKNIQRIVIKIGTNTLSMPDGTPDKNKIEELAEDISVLKNKGYKVLIVSSGAIGFGMQFLGLDKRPSGIEMKQACAAVGQPVLMEHWRKSFSKRNIVTAQILLTRETFDERRSFLNLRNVVEKLLSLGTVPVLNENDSISTVEIGDIFGDNDSLSAHIASKLNAELLILLTDIDALYNKDPKKYPEASPIDVVEKLTGEILSAAGNAGSSKGTGGMKTKLHAVEIASRAGCRTVLADGSIKGVLNKIVSGEKIGTLFLPSGKLGARARWILSARPKGKILIDAGAVKALGKRKSLLPKGITGVEGHFNHGDVVMLGEEYAGITSWDSDDIKKIMGRHSREIKNILGAGFTEEIVKAENIVSIKEINNGKTNKY